MLYGKISNIVKLKPTKKGSLASSISVLNVAYDNVLVRGCYENDVSLVKWSNSSHLSSNSISYSKLCCSQIESKILNLVNNFDGDPLKIACSLADLR